MARELGHELMAMEDVQETILSHVEPIDTESVHLRDATGAVLREAITARDYLPPFDNSGMDGFGVHVADVAAASDGQGVTLEVQNVVAAGDTGDRPLSTGKAIRIMTGAPVPEGVEAVVPHELTQHDECSVTFSAPVRAGQNIRKRGEDFRPGDPALNPGVVLRGPHLGICGTLGWDRVKVSRKLRVAILSPGNELVEVGEPCGPGQIRNSNGYSLRGALFDLGAEPVSLGITPDTKEAVWDAIRGALRDGADAIVSTGGVSAGDFDYVQEVVREHGEPGYRFKVAMRPGKPQVFGVFDGRPLFGLPGNPAASILSFELLVRPALRKMRGESHVDESRFGVRFPFEYKYRSGRVFLLRARVVPDEANPQGGFRVEPPGAQGSGLLGSLGSANAILILPSDRDRIDEGEVMPAQWIGGRP